MDLARFLVVEHGADAAAQDKRRWTPLHEVRSRGNMDLVRLRFVEHSANVAQDNDRFLAVEHDAKAKLLLFWTDVCTYLVCRSESIVISFFRQVFAHS